MTKRTGILAAVALALFVSIAGAQGPIMDMVANKVIQKYQASTCEQLWEARSQPKGPQEQELIQILRNDPQMRTQFLNRIAGPVANKMFECGMIP